MSISGPQDRRPPAIDGEKSEEQPSQEEPTDVFDSLLTLESQYHKEGYDLGVTDGARSGRIEGRLFGLQKGFEKFAEMGRLQGRAAIWHARVDAGEGNVRLKRHVERLRELTDETTLSTENGEEDVGEVEARVRDAKGKAEVVGRAIGDEVTGGDGTATDQSNGLRVVRRGGVAAGGVAGRGTGEMEDFVGIGKGRMG